MERKMKDSGIPWIGMIPSDWCLLHFKYSGSFEKGKLPNSTNVDGKGFPIIGASEMNGKPPTLFTEQQDIPMCGNEDVLILWDGANAGLVANNLQGIVSSTVVKYSCNDNRCNVQYVYYQYKTLERYFKSKVSGTTIPHMNMKFINGSPMLLPPLPTQQCIADFLDRKCAEIDELAALQETMIDELKRYKQSVITEAVTKGLDPNVPMKDSGVEWIGKTPEGWSVGRIKNVASLFGRIGFRGYTSDDLNKDGVGAITLSPSNMLPMSMDYTNVTYLSWKKYEESPEIKIQNGDLLMVKTGSSYGKVSFVDNLPREATVNPQILRIVPNIHSKYLGYFLQTTYFSFQVEGGVVGGTIPTISQEKINNFRVILPPLTEQRAIADYLDRKCAEIDELIAIKQQKIEALKEYKKSVIFEYVTGKKEVEC